MRRKFVATATIYGKRVYVRGSATERANGICRAFLGLFPDEEAAASCFVGNCRPIFDKDMALSILRGDGITYALVYNWMSEYVSIHKLKIKKDELARAASRYRRILDSLGIEYDVDNRV
jgi:hypothetical protein